MAILLKKMWVCCVMPSCTKFKSYLFKRSFLSVKILQMLIALSSYWKMFFFYFIFYFYFDSFISFPAFKFSWSLSLPSYFCFFFFLLIGRLVCKTFVRYLTFDQIKSIPYWLKLSLSEFIICKKLELKILMKRLTSSYEMVNWICY